MGVYYTILSVFIYVRSIPLEREGGKWGSGGRMKKKKRNTTNTFETSSMFLPEYSGMCSFKYVTLFKCPFSC